MNSWLVLKSAHGRELSAVEGFLFLGIQAYCPTIKHFTKPKRKSSPVEITQPAFPGYLFAENGFRFDDISSVASIRIARVRRLYFGEELCMVKNSEIDRMQSEDSERRITQDDPVVFCCGDNVRVNTGPFVGCIGVVKSVQGQRIELSLTKFAAKIYMPAFSLEKLRAHDTVQ